MRARVGRGNSRIPQTLAGVAAEYAVAAELSRRSYIASLTLKNTRGVDLLASNADASRSVGIQVKGSQGRRRAWVLDKKAETYQARRLFYVFVTLLDLTSRPEFFVVPSKDVARYTKTSHRRWAQKTWQKGPEAPRQSNEGVQGPRGQVS